MKKTLLTGIAVLFLATGTAHASGIGWKHGKCYFYTSDHHIGEFYGKGWRKIVREIMKGNEVERLCRARVKACHDRGEPVCADDFEYPRYKGNKKSEPARQADDIK